MKCTALLCSSLAGWMAAPLAIPSPLDIVACVFVTEQYVLYYSRNFGIASNVAISRASSFVPWEPFMRNGNAPTNTHYTVPAVAYTRLGPLQCNYNASCINNKHTFGDNFYLFSVRSWDAITWRQRLCGTGTFNIRLYFWCRSLPGVYYYH